jgi:2-aminoadipate transaminase
MEVEVMAEKKIISFGRGVPDNAALLSAKRLIKTAWDQAREKYPNMELVQYGTPGVTDPCGLMGLRDIIGNQFMPNVKDGFVAATNGGLEAISFIMLNLLPPRGVINPTLLVESMTYNRVIEGAIKLGYRVVGIPMTHEGPDLNALEESIKTNGAVAFYQIAPHHNPMGGTTSVENEVEAGKICDKYGIKHIVDVAYQDLRYDDKENDLLDISDLPQTILAGSFTKTFCPGFKVGFIAHNRGLLPTLANTIANWRINPVHPAQAILEMAIRHGEWEKHLEFIQKFYGERAKVMEEAIRQHFPETLELPFVGPLNGGGFCIIMAPDISLDNEADFREACKEAGVIVEDPTFMTKDDLIQFYNQHGSIPYRVTFLSLDPENIRLGIQRIRQVADGFSMSSAATG